MNVLFLDQFSELGGAQQCLLDLMPAVQSAGWQADAGLPGNGPLISRLRQMSVTVDPIPGGRFASGHKTLADAWRFSSQFRALAAAIHRLALKADADLIYVNGPRLLPAAAWAARRRWPLLFHCHNHLSHPAALVAGLALQWASARVIACCRFAAQPIAPRVPPSRLHIVDNGVPDLAAPARPSSSRDGLRIGMLGRISAEKGQAEFLSAARLLTDVLPRTRFLIAGETLFGDPAAVAYRRRLDQMAAGLPVQFVGWRDDAGAFLAGLDLLVVPSMREPGAPRVILEAFSAGVPVVAFPSGGIPEIVADGKTGFLTSPATPSVLAARILDLVRQPHLLESAARAARATWSERFNLHRYREQITAIMAEAASRRRSTPRLAATVSAP
jgi:glycosyltransferase involved in cell wall biosynthesis